MGRPQVAMDRGAASARQIVARYSRPRLAQYPRLSAGSEPADADAFIVHDHASGALSYFAHGNSSVREQCGSTDPRSARSCDHGYLQANPNRLDAHDTGAPRLTTWNQHSVSAATRVPPGLG